MDNRKWQSGAAGSAPAVEASPSTGFPTDGNPGTATPATVPGARWFHQVGEELRNLISAAGLTPSDSDLTQLQQAISALISQGGIKTPVRAATTANIATLAGGAPNSLDGVTLAVNDRILVKDQATGSQNGIYVVTTLGTGANGTWSRATDADSVGELFGGMLVVVQEGTVSADSIWELATDGAITIGTTAINWTRKDSGVSSDVGKVSWFPLTTAPSGYLKANGAAISRTAYSALFDVLVKSAAVAISIASPGVVTWNNHGRSANDPIKFTTTGALPTGLVVGITYFVVGASITTNTFQLSATPGGAAINTSGTQAGTHTAINAPFGDGNGTTTFNLPDLRGEFPRGWDDGRGVDSGRVFGSAQADDLRSHTHPAMLSPSGSIISGANFQGGSGFGWNSPSGATGGTETRPRNIALLACIKY